jgi:uncharacterized membrane protein YbhN (UPF0104 family)
MNNKKTYLHLFKLTIGISIIYYLYNHHKDAFSGSWNYISSYSFLLLLGVQILIHSITTLRWYQIINQIQTRGISYLKLFSIHWSSQFYGLILPGSLGVDAGKLIMANHQKIALKKYSLAILIDRLHALLTLIITILTLYLIKTPILQFCAIIIVFTIMPKLIQISKQLFSGKTQSIKSFFLTTIGLVLSLVSFQLKVLSFLFLISISNHYKEFDFYSMIMALNLGQFIEAFSFVPGNIGVGHWSFGELLNKINLIEGVKIYHYYFLAKISFKLLGYFPHILIEINQMRRTLISDLPSYQKQVTADKMAMPESTTKHT